MTIMRAVVHGLLLNAAQVRNIFTAQFTAVGEDDPLAMWDTYITSIYDLFQDLVADVVTFSNYEIFSLSTHDWLLTADVPMTFTGVGVADQMPNQVAMVLIGKALGKRHLGRKFFSGLAEDAVTGNNLVTGAAATAASMLAAYIAPVIGSGESRLDPGILDKTFTFHPFVGGVVSTFMGSMRRRKPGVGI